MHFQCKDNRPTLNDNKLKLLYTLYFLNRKARSALGVHSPT